MNSEILDKADSLGYEIIETTDQCNGYPSNIKKAIIGFDTFEEAETFAAANGLRVTDFHRKQGWELWVRNNSTAYSAFNLVDLYSDDPCYSHYLCGDEQEFTEHIKEQIANLNDFALIQELMEQKTKIWDEFCTLGEDEFILVKDGEFDCVEQLYKMSYEYDSTYYAIGVI